MRRTVALGTFATKRAGVGAHIGRLGAQLVTLLADVTRIALALRNDAVKVAATVDRARRRRIFTWLGTSLIKAFMCV
jgi:hypothetical protein